MADIQVVNSEPLGDIFTVTTHTIDGKFHKTRWPKETLGIRAAEYDLEPEDPEVLELVMLEPWVTEFDPHEVHPLFAAKSVAKALDIMRARLERVREVHGSPKDPAKRMLARAVANGHATRGLVLAHGHFHKHVHPGLVVPVQAMRDEGREIHASRTVQLSSEPMSLAAHILASHAERASGPGAGPTRKVPLDEIRKMERQDVPEPEPAPVHIDHGHQEEMIRVATRKR